ncbi:MAG: prephenate dehydrogenase [Acidiferrobacteraceae bacterium]
MIIKRLAIIGVGLIGGSLARALRAEGVVDEIIGVGPGAAELDLALELGVIDRSETSPARAARGADVIVLATPVGSMPLLFEAIAPNLSKDAVVTDVGSVKEVLVTAARSALGAHFPRYVPGHPIAGAEQSGVRASRPDLFTGRRVVLTPVADTEPAAVERVTRLWQAVGATVSTLDPRQHDEILALTSHLPHLLAFSAVGLLGDHDSGHLPGGASLLDFVGTGFCDFTRIAASDPAMWRDICLNNPRALIQVVAAYRDRLDVLSRALAEGDQGRLFEIFERAQRLRTHYPDCADRP